MANRVAALCLSTLSRSAGVASRRAVLAAATRNNYYHTTPPWNQEATRGPTRPPDSNPNVAQNPIAASMAKSTTPTGNNKTTAPQTEEDHRNAAFLGEADSDDGFEADIEINPDKHTHKFSDVAASGLHGQAGEGDEPIERERKPQEPVDASQSAFLGEADSDDGHESDREINPEKYRHRIDDTQHAAFLGEGDSNDAHESDKEINPEKYSHGIEDSGVSGMHGESGHDDEPFERDRK